MNIAQGILAEFEGESAATRKCLERLPEDQLGWQPHEKSMTLGYLAHHIASGPQSILSMLLKDSMDISEMAKSPGPENKAEILAAFDQSLDFLRQNLGGQSDEWALSEWKLTAGEQVLFAMPRLAVARMILLSHIYHHRGQLSVYMRMLDIPVPSIYGPSADEMPDFFPKAQAAG
jgi:uncharacterized damage-inducible protein DinB